MPEETEDQTIYKVVVTTRSNTWAGASENALERRREEWDETRVLRPHKRGLDRHASLSLREITAGTDPRPPALRRIVQDMQRPFLVR